MRILIVEDETGLAEAVAAILKKERYSTDIAKDGMLKGPSIELYKEILAVHPTLHLIASGGVSSMADIHALDAAGVPAVIFGKAIYEGKITFKELEQINLSC